MKKFLKIVGSIALVIFLVSATALVRQPHNYLSLETFSGGIDIADGSQAAGYVYTSSNSAGLGTWSPLLGATTLDSVTAYTGTVIPLSVNSNYIIKANPAFTSIGMDTLVLPVGTTGNWIHLSFITKDSVIRYRGSGTSTAAFTTAVAQQDKWYKNYGGNWY